MNIIALTGKAGSGKDTVADILCKEHGFTRVAFADPMKRFCAELFRFSVDQLWGPSERRNAADPRYPRAAHKWQYVRAYEVECACCGTSQLTESGCFLTPRYALQMLGTEWGRTMYTRVWSDHALDTARRLLIGERHRRVSYLPHRGLIDRGEGEGPEDIAGVVIPDCRFHEELTDVRRAGGRIWRRTGAGTLTGAAAAHVSETEKLEWDVEIPWLKDVGELPNVVKRLLEDK